MDNVNKVKSSINVHATASLKKQLDKELELEDPQHAEAKSIIKKNKKEHKDANPKRNE